MLIKATAFMFGLALIIAAAITINQLAIAASEVSRVHSERLQPESGTTTP